jgi:hypothetical protein
LVQINISTKYNLNDIFVALICMDRLEKKISSQIYESSHEHVKDVAEMARE